MSQVALFPTTHKISFLRLEITFIYTPEITELRFSARVSEPLKGSMKSMKLRYFKFELKPSLEWCHAQKLKLSSPKFSSKPVLITEICDPE